MLYKAESPIFIIDMKVKLILLCLATANLALAGVVPTPPATVSVPAFPDKNL